MSRAPRCIVCKQGGRKVLPGVIACEQHAKHVRTAGTVAGAALKAGVIAGLEQVQPGLYEKMQTIFWTTYETFKKD